MTRPLLPRPELVVRIPLEGAVVVSSTAENDDDHERLLRWIEASYERVDLVVRAVALGDGVEA